MNERLTLIAQRQRPRAIADIAVATGLSFTLLLYAEMLVVNAWLVLGLS